MSLQYQPSVKKTKQKGIGGFFILKKKSCPTKYISDVQVIKPATAKEGEIISEKLENQTTNTNTILKNEILGSDVGYTNNETSGLKRKQSLDNKKLPKKKAKIATMNVFKSNYFNN